MQTWSYLLKKSFMENFNFCAVKSTEENLSKSFILCQLLSTKTLASGSKSIKYYFLFLPLFDLCLLSRSDLFNMFCLS